MSPKGGRLRTRTIPKGSASKQGPFFKPGQQSKACILLLFCNHGRTLERGRPIRTNCPIPKLEIRTPSKKTVRTVSSSSKSLSCGIARAVIVVPAGVLNPPGHPLQVPEPGSRRNAPDPACNPQNRSKPIGGLTPKQLRETRKHLLVNRTTW